MLLTDKLYAKQSKVVRVHRMLPALLVCLELHSARILLTQSFALSLMRIVPGLIYSCLPIEVCSAPCASS